jgi:hypothetical protein
VRPAFPRLAGPSAMVLGSVAVVLPLVSGAPALGVSAAPAAPGAGAVVAAAQPLTGAPAVVSGGAGDGATLVAPAAAHPVTPEVDEVPIPDAERADAPRLAAISDPEPVTGYGIVGATWQGQEPATLGLQVRTLDIGEWSDWQVLPWHDEHAPDPGTEEARHARVGSEPVVVGDVEQVQVRVTSASGAAPRDLELSVIDPGISAADDDPVTTAATTTAATGGPTAARPAVYTAAESSLATRVAVTDPPGVRAPRPRIRSRKAWGANESLRSGSPSYGTVKAGFVHHTVNANKYTRAEVPAIIRGIYAYHTQSNGWSDIGYNFVVDRFGRIWQGRFGDVTRNVIGAHTYGYNDVSFAMSAIGNYETAQPSRAMLRAYAKLFGWKLGQYGIPAGARNRVLHGHTFRAINGHRDSNLSSTACPGRYLYARIPTIRKLATRWQRTGTLKAPDSQTSPSPTPAPEPSPTPTPTPGPSPAPTLPKPDGPDPLRDLQADGFPDLLARDAATRRLQVLQGDGGPGFGDRRMAVQSVGSRVLFTGVGDVTGDGRPDLLVRAQKGNLAKVRPGRPDGLFAAGIAGTDRFANADALAGVGQMVGNRHPDVVMRDAATGKIWLFPGQAGGHWGRKQAIIRNGSRLSMINGAGDLDGDGRNDLLARDGRSLVLYPGRGMGRVGAPRVIQRGWGGKDIAAAGYDVTGDGRPDVVARDRDTHRTWIYVTRADGTIVGRFGGWAGWADLTRISALGDVTGDDEPDLLGRTDSGSLMVLPSRGTRWLQGPVETGRLARGADFAQVVGDWNGDGHVDVVTRSNGTMWLYRGTGGGGLRDRVVLVRDWGTRTFLVGAGDMDRDGDPDLISRTPDGRIWVNAGDGRTGMERRYVAREKMFRADVVTAAGYWNDDGARDLIVRRASTDQLYLVPGTADGVLGRPEPLPGGRNFSAYDRIIGVGYFDRDGHADVVARERGKGRLWLFAGSKSGLRPREYVASGMNRYDLFG